MCKKLPVGEFDWVKRLSIFAEDRIKDYNENSDYGASLEVDIRYLSIYNIFTKTYYFYLKENNYQHKNLLQPLKTKKNMLYTYQH